MINPFPGIGGAARVGLGSIGHVAEIVIAGLWFIIMATIAIGLLVLLVRFLLVATRAAQLYVEKNSPHTAVAEEEPSAPVVPVAVVDAPSSVPPTTIVTPPARTPRAPRTPKTPPTL
jgi:hypothetical protein